MASDAKDTISKELKTSKIIKEPNTGNDSVNKTQRKNKKDEETEIEFNWVKLKHDMDKMMQGQESSKDKFIRRVKENPLVPFGCAVTTAALCMGLYSFRVGNKRMSQIMMRSRILAQGFTVTVMIIGVGYAANKKADIEKLLKENNDKKD